MTSKYINYPDKKFTDDAQFEISKLKDFNVIVKNKFPMLILSKAIDCWQRLLNDVDRVRSKNHGHLHMSMLLLPKLWFINMLAIGSGYIMNYTFNDDSIMIIYSHH